MSGKRVQRLAERLAQRMGEIDATVTTSLYRDLGPNEQDESPTGDHYNRLWEAILDECEAAGVPITAGMLGYKL